MKIKRKTEGEKKPRSSFAGLPVMKKSLGALADVRILLAVFAVVLVVMGIFAFAFRQIHIGYVEEDGVIVTSSDVYDRLNRGSGDADVVELTNVKGNDEIFSRGGKYYVGQDMTEYKAEYPIYANNGQSLYFTNDESQLVTEDFDLLSTYAGMFVADGTSFNAGRDQADVETIYLVKLKNGLYENALPMTFSKAGYTKALPVNCIVHFDEDGIRYYDEKGGILSYGELTDAVSLTVEINGQTYTYTEFLEALKGAGADTVQTPSDTAGQTPEEIEEPEEEQQEQLTGGQTVPSQQVDSQKPENDSDDKDNSDNKEKKDQSQGTTGGSSAAAATGSTSGSNSDSGSSSSGKDSGKDGKDGSTSGSSSSQAHPGSSASADAPYQKPSVKVNSVKPGTYSVDLDVTITDDGGYLKKVTSRVRWNNQNNEQRKSVKESGSYTINNLESGQEMTLILEMKYRNTLGEYVTEEVYRTTFETLSIEEGTNTLYLDYQPDTYDTARKTGGYERIYPDQIEIRHMTIREGKDSILENAASTMDYVRYFRINIYDADTAGQDVPVATFVLSNSDKKKMLIKEDTESEDTGSGETGSGETGSGETGSEETGSENTGSGETGSTGGSTGSTQEGLNWMSDKVTAPLDPAKNYYYEFELKDRYDESLKVKYENGENNTSRYDDKGDLRTGTASDRKAYTCKQHPTGKLTMGGASYNTQTISVALTNPNQCTVSDLYIAVQDSYGRYIGHKKEADGNISGHLINGGQLTNDARYMLMDKPADGLSLYEGLTGSNNAPYKGTEKAEWSKFKVPSFANSTYTITLNISYDIGDRYGDVDETTGKHTGVYTTALATRSNCKTTSLNTLGNVSFDRAAGDMYADQVIYNYASSRISDSLLPMIYRYDYELKNTESASDVPLKLRVSKNYVEVKEKQGVLLTVPGISDVEAKDWSFNYSYSYRLRNDSSRTIHTVTGHMSWDQAKGAVTRTIYVDDDPPKDSAVTYDVDAYSAYIAALAKMTSYPGIINDDKASENSVVVTSAVSVMLDFGAEINKDYSLGMPVDGLSDAITKVKGQAESERSFSNVILYALSAGRTPLSFRVGLLKSNQIYQADAKAYAYQSGNMDAEIDDDGNIKNGTVGAPRITLVTNTDATLPLKTLKGEPYVNMELFSSSSELRLFDFYVLDTDKAILPKKDGEDPHVTVSIYQYNKDAATVEASETLVARRTGLPVAHSEEEAKKLQGDLVFSGLNNGQTYRIKVTAEVYDVTPDGSDRKYNQLIGVQEESTFWQENGVWQDVVGTSVTTDLTLEEVLNDDPDTMANQLIDFTTAETEGSGWEVGYLDGATGGITRDKSWRTTPLMDLRKYDTAGNPIDLTYQDVFLAREIWDMRVFYYDKDQKYLGYIRYAASVNTAAGANRYSIVTLPDVRLDGTNNGDWEVGDIAYARVCFSGSNSNVVFFGRLDDSYLTRQSENSASYTDILGTMMHADKNLWNSLGSRMNGSQSIPTTGGQTISVSGYYETAIKVEGGQIVWITSNSSQGTYNRDLIFLDKNGNIILNTSEDGSTSSVRRIRYGDMIVAPTNASSMLVQYRSDNDREKNCKLYILKDKKWAEQYNAWRAGSSDKPVGAGDSSQLRVERGKALNGNGVYNQASDRLYEVTSRIEVNAGDLCYLSNQGQMIGYYDENDKFVGASSQNWVSYGYLVIPEGVKYIRFGNYNWSKSSQHDQSLLNGSVYNTDGAYPIIFLKCGNLKTAYENQLKTGGDTTASSDQMYANLRVQLKDGVNNYFTNGASQDGKYWLEVHEVKYNGEEVSDEKLMKAPGTKEAETTIPCIETADGKRAQEVNRCVAVPVKKGYSYKVILYAQVGSQSSVEVGKVYFTVRDSGEPVYGISSAFQIVGVRNKPYGDYILNKDITMTDDLSSNGGTLYGELDLQGHTLTNTRLTGGIFDNIGSAAKKQGAIRNGTIQFQAIRSTGDNNIYPFTYSNYGTLENLNFKVDVQNPYSSSGGEKIYDNSRWNSEQYSNMIRNNYGTLRNFTLEYQADLLSSYGTGFIWNNIGLVQNGYIYGDGAVMGGSYVGGLVAINDTTGKVRNIYSTINSKSNSTAQGGNITVTYANGTVVGNNRGKTENVLATGNVYTFTSAKSGSNYLFGSESYYTTRGCAVGLTTNRMDTSNCYYATLGTNRRVNYSSSSLNKRVEAGMLVDASWWSDFYQHADGEEGLLDNLEEMLAGGYFPWIDMGNAREKYSILQPYLTMDVGSAASFDLLKSTVDNYVYSEDGFATANVTFSFMNQSGYEVSSISMDGLDCTILPGQGENKETGFYEVKATLKVSEKSGRYKTGYNVKSVTYKRSANSNSTIRYAFNGSENTNGERIVDAEFFYPLKNTQEWSEYFTDSRSDWNFRIWGADTWDFDKPYTVSGLLGNKQKYPVSVKDFDYTGHLDGTLFVKNADGNYEPKVIDGQVQTHVLKNLCDYSLNYNANNNFKDYTVRGYVFRSVDGGISNLTIQDMTIGVERSVHKENVKAMTSSQVTAETISVGESNLRQTVSNSYNQKGLVRYLTESSYLENVHLIGGVMAPSRNGAEYMGGLVGQANNYTSLKQCSATGLKILTSSQAGDLRVGGLVGYITAYGDMEDCYVADLNMQAVLSKNNSFNSQGVGGIVGCAGDSSSLNNCYSSGTLTSQVMSTGGLVGYMSGTSALTDCYSAMNLSLESTNGAGLLAKNTGTLTISNCLYTGSLGVASMSDTVHLFLGYNSSSASLDKCYYYQPHLESNSSLIDAGATAMSYDKLTKDDAYDAIFSEDHHYRYSWYLNGKTLGTTGEQGAYLPALKAGEAMMLGQLTDGVCHVPAIAEESLEIRDVWAFASVDRTDKLAAASGGLVDANAAWYNKDQLSLTYDPNDVEFTLVLGSSNGKNAPDYQVKSVEVEGLATGTLGGQDNFNDNSNTTGVFSWEMLKSKAVRMEIAPINVTATGDSSEAGEGGDTESGETAAAGSFAYRIRLLGAEMSSYRDVYNVVVTLDNGVVLKKTFQFSNAAGVQEAKYLPIHNAYEWNLYLGETGGIPEAAKKAAEIPADNRTDQEKTLAKYKDWTYRGYGSSSFNIEIADTVDFSVLTDIDGKNENPVMNVLANNVRGQINTDTDQSIGRIQNLAMEKVDNTTSGLFRNIGGSVTDLTFANNTIRWKAKNRASDNSGLLGQVAGGMKNCTFTNTTLTGGGSFFGIMAVCDGNIEDVTVTNSYVEADAGYVGGLSGYLRGDLINVQAKGDDSGDFGYQVIGTSYIGGLVGRIYSTDHETNGHALIGGPDYTSNLEEGEERTDLNKEGWYSKLISEDYDYRADRTGSVSDQYIYDSLSCNYALIKNVTLENINVAASNTIAGGIAAEVSYIKKAMGYGYTLIEDVNASEVQVQVLNRPASNEAYTGGLIGLAPTVMVHGVTLDAMTVEVTSGSHVGGMFGYVNYRSDYDYSAYGSGTDRVQYFLSVLDDITLTNSSVQGGSYTGGLIGSSPHWSMNHNIKLDHNVVLGQGSRVGGMAGLINNSYTTDLTVQNQQVYNSGESQYTGGIIGYTSAYGTRRVMAVGIQVLASGDSSSYVGGLYGSAAPTRDTQEHSNVSADIRVYGHDYVGGLYGNGSWLHYTDVNQKGTYTNATGVTLDLTGKETVRVTGTGDYVGGLVGTTGSAINYDHVSHVTVIGNGMATGGVAGKRTGDWIRNSDFQDINVIGSGTGTSAGSAYVGAEEKTGEFTNGSCVGGISGTESNSGAMYTRFQDVNVYGSGDYVGGLVGLKSMYYMQEVDAERITVHAMGEKYVGGLIGYSSTNSTSSRLITDDITVNAPNASSYVGGFAGYADSLNTSGGGLTESLIKVTIEANSATTNVGGLIGYGKDIYSLYWNTVEATVKAPNAEYVAGVIGQLENNGGRFHLYRTLVSADVTGKDYVGAMIGYSGTYQPVGNDGTYAGIYCDLIAAKLKVAGSQEQATASYVYSSSVDGAVQKDVIPVSVGASSPYPYRQRLWDGSSITYGYSEANGTGGTATGTEVSITDQIFKWYNNTESKLKYWNDSAETDQPALNKENRVNAYALVSQNALKSTRLYYGGNYGLDLSVYTGDVKGSQVTFAASETLLASNTKYNLYGLYEAMTNTWKDSTEDNSAEAHYLYLPTPLNPLLLHADSAKNVNGTDRYVPYYIGTATKTDNGGTGVWTFKMTGGVCLPGTHGSILTDTSHTVGTLADINLKTNPKVYASNAYTLNVEFTTADRYDNAWIEVYDNTDGKAGAGETVDNTGATGGTGDSTGTTGGTGDNTGATGGTGDNTGATGGTGDNTGATGGTGDSTGTTGGTTGSGDTTSDKLLYRVRAQESSPTYSMLYDFTTPITIKITNAKPGTSGRYVAAQINVDGKKIRKHAVISSSYMYVIGNDGKLYYYNNGWSGTAELYTTQPPTGEKAINIVIDNNNTSMLTDKGCILYPGGNGTYNKKYLQCIVGALEDNNNFGDSPKRESTTQDTTGGQDSTGGQDTTDGQDTGSIQTVTGTNTYAGTGNLLHRTAQALKTVAEDQIGTSAGQTDTVTNVAAQKTSAGTGTTAPRLRDCPYLIASVNGLPRGVQPAPASMQVAGRTTDNTKVVTGTAAGNTKAVTGTAAGNIKAVVSTTAGNTKAVASTATGNTKAVASMEASVRTIASNTAQSDTEDKMENKSNTENLSNTDAKAENTTSDEKSGSTTGAAAGNAGAGAATEGSTTGEGTAADSTTGAVTGSAGDGAATEGSTSGAGTAADSATGAATDEAAGDVTTTDGSTTGEGTADDSTTTGAEATLPSDTVLDDESDVTFDESLLDAEPLYQFDYKDYHICTYLTYSLIFDGDQVTVRNMQLFVKNGQLFALNAPDEVVPGSVLIDTYQGHTYMTVVTQDGKMVDLMDEINYPEDFQNRDIRAISTNLFSDLTFVQVEYENGTIETFNYLTGAVISVEEGGEEGTSSEMDFFSYIMAFFRDKFDTAYAEVSNAYQNAVSMQDFLSTQSWKDWFAKDGKSGTDGTSDVLADATFASDSTEDGTANGQGEATDEISETDVTASESGTDGTEAGGDGSSDNIAGVDVPETADGSNSAVSAGDGNASGNTAGMDMPENTEGANAGQTGTGDVIGSMPGVAGNDDQQSVDGSQQANPSGDTLNGGVVGDEALAGETSDVTETSDQEQTDTLPEQNDGVETEAQDGQSEADDSQAAVSVPTDNGFDDELIIAYNADSKGYAVYSAQDLLTEEDEKLVSVDKKMDEYLQNGGELTGTAPKIQSLEVNRSQKNGILIMLVIGIAIAGMLTILAVQKYSRRRR